MCDKAKDEGTKNMATQLKRASDVLPHHLFRANPRHIALCEFARVCEWNPYEQAYGYFIVVTVDDEEAKDLNGRRFMVDTYHVEKPYASDMNGRIKKIAEIDKVSAWRFRHMLHDCYYAAICEVTDDTAHHFEDLGDLNDLRFLHPNESGHYAEKDCIRSAHLARELGFSWTFGDCGIDLVRKDAEVVPVLKARQLAREMADGHALIPTYISTWKIADFERHIMEHHDDTATVEVYENYRDRIAETLDHNDALNETRPCEGQMRLFDPDTLEPFPAEDDQD